MAWRALVVTLVLVLPSASAQEPAWKDPVEQGGVRIVLRKAPLFSKASLDAVRGGSPLPGIARLTFAKPGWFLNRAVAAESYAMGFDVAEGVLQMTLHDGKGARLSSESFWIEPPTAIEPVAELAASDGAVVVTIRVDTVRLSFRFVPKEALEAVARGVETRVGRVVLVSDVGNPGMAAELAKEADRAIDVHAGLLGAAAPEGPFRIHLFGTEKAYQAADKLVTGGRFQRNGAVASSLTMQAYLWHVPIREAGATLKARALVLHELGHLVAYASRRASTSWPYWVSEGLAEEGTRRALGKDGEAFHADQVGRWRGAEAVGNVPPLEDVLTRYAGPDLNGWYTSAYFFAKRLSAEGKALPELLDRLESERLQSRSILAAREAIDPRAPALWRAIREETLQGPPPPLAVFGHLDPTADGWRLATQPDGQGRVLLPGQACRDGGVLEASFSWEPVRLRQADFYLAYAAGREGVQFLKVAILPKELVLFRYFDDRWEEWGRRAPAKELASDAWHAVRIGLEAKARKVTVQVDAAAAAEFELRAYVPVDGTWAGFGAYDSIVHVKDVKVR